VVPAIPKIELWQETSKEINRISRNELKDFAMGLENDIKT
jgi:hypothetical protein